MAISSFTLGYLISIASSFRGRSERVCLELGESQALFFDLSDFLAPISDVIGRPVEMLSEELLLARRGPAETVSYREARLIYRWLLGIESYRVVDLGSPEPEAWIDLNYPCDLGRRYDVVINNGTSEHVFNQANVFKFMHDHTAIGGMMVHYTCGLGWIEHGFYNVQPSFFFDLAKYNGYEVVSCHLVNDEISLPLRAGEINGAELSQDPRLRDSLLHCCLRRWDDAPFRFPIQRPYQPSH